MKRKSSVPRSRLRLFKNPNPTQPSDLDSVKINERSLTITLDSIGDGVICTDQAGLITRINRVAQQLTGWPIVEAEGRQLSAIFQIVDGESDIVFEVPFKAAMHSGLPVNLPPNTVLVARDGRRYSIEDSASPIREREGASIYGIVLVFRDITEKKRLEFELQQAKKLETIGLLAGGVAHDFNNLLAGIIGYAELLQLNLKSNPQLEGYAQTILETAERGAKLTNQLLAFSRKGKRISVPVDIHEHIRSAVMLLRTSTDKRISITTSFNAPFAMVIGDPTILETALLNLGLNARDATPVGGEIVFKTKVAYLELPFITSASLGIDPGEYLEVSITDSGAGMSAEVMSHLYEPFFTTKEIGRGTGLGLASVYGTIKEHNGAIKVESDVEKGTNFTLYLPLSRSTTASLKAEDSDVLRGSGCILLVDDELVVRNATAGMLEAIGYEVLLAENGAQAIEIYKREQGRIQLVILDVVMPVLSGPDTFFALRNINGEVNVIFASGYMFEKSAEDVLRRDRFGFIQKPFRRNSLYKAIEESLARCTSRIDSVQSSFTHQ